MAKPCRLCSSKRYGNLSWCYLHWKAREKAKREEKQRRKDERRKNSKKYQTSQRKKLIKKLDAVFSKLVRLPGKCLRCGFGPPDRTLQCSHIWSRENLSVRWDEKNAKPLCGGCHIWWHAHPAEAWAWLATKRDPFELEELKLRANATRHWTDDELATLLLNLSDKLSRLTATQ